jgi:hypothetical protein|tara:strand:+ start:1924 stop:2658 length:735 start_codon:yes stop_codon:yes gene_type:complete
MIRYIKLSNEKNRDAEVTYRSLNPKASIKLGINSPGDVINRRVLKSTTTTDFSTLIADFKLDKTEDEELQKSILLSEEIIKNDPEIDFEMGGKYISGLQRVYVNEQQKPVFKVRKTEKIFSPTAELKEEREPKYNESNILDQIVKWTGKMMPKSKMYNKLVFTKKYQIKHINGLTYDFLFEMAKQLSDKDSLMMLGGGKSGKEPLVMNDGGKPYRAFLEGRVKEERYCLILHLTDQELKSLPKK